MKYWLVTESGNYADEFNLEAMQIFEGETEAEVLDSVFEDRLSDEEDDEWPKEFYFGTNECIEYDSKEELYDSVSITEITKEEYDTINKLLGTSFGTGAIL